MLPQQLHFHFKVYYPQVSATEHQPESQKA